MNINNLRPKLKKQTDETSVMFEYIKEHVKRGRSAKVIADNLGVSQSTVLNVLNKNGTSLKELKGKK